MTVRNVYAGQFRSSTSSPTSNSRSRVASGGGDGGGPPRAALLGGGKIEVTTKNLERGKVYWGRNFRKGLQKKVTKKILGYDYETKSPEGRQI